VPGSRWSNATFKTESRFIVPFLWADFDLLTGTARLFAGYVEHKTWTPRFTPISCVDGAI
jgi:hypothetical protein